MSSGYYPFDEKSGDLGVQKLVAVRDALKDILENRGGYDRASIPAAFNNEVSEDAAVDGIYEGHLYLALELINKCFIKPEIDAAQLQYLVETLMDNDPDDGVADGGVTVLDAWRKSAEELVGRKCKTRKESLRERFGKDAVASAGSPR